MVVRCQPGNLGLRRITLTIGRCGTPLSADEEAAIRQHCAVPDGARRIPADPACQQERATGYTAWYLVGWIWWIGEYEQFDGGI
ncbi:MAG TPA: hypothetical protein VFS21_32175 [Roseiflexaceae bacterium]|nr:hypothetical protein [Roseiflexaceae bacterium]